MSDQKDAVNIGITLSSQIITASLTMIAVMGAFAVFVIDKRNVGPLYYSITGFAFISFIGSVFAAGKAINKARNEGFAGRWNIVDTKFLFNMQAALALLGIIMFSTSIFIGKEKADDYQLQIQKLKSEILLIKKLDSMNFHKMNIHSMYIESRIRSDSAQINNLNQSLRSYKAALKQKHSK
jgi:hypothetical protein